MLDVFTPARYVLAVCFGLSAAACDAKTKKISNLLVAVMLAAWFVVLFPQILFDTKGAIRASVDGGIALVLCTLFFGLVFRASKGGLGGGDVKFVAAIGLYLGVVGVFWVVLFGFVLAAVVSVTLTAVGKLGRKEPFPLAPFLFAGILLQLLLHYAFKWI